MKPKNRLEIRNGIRILHVGNRTYILGNVQGSNNQTRVPEKHVDVLKPDGYSIVNTPSFLHKAYLEMYFDPLMVPAGALEHVDSLQNCEDILLSIVVTKFLQDLKKPQCGVLAVKSSLSIKSLEDEACKLLCVCGSWYSRPSLIRPIRP